MPFPQLLLSEMVWTGISTGDSVTILVLLTLLLGGGGLVLYLVKQSVDRNDFLNPTEEGEGIDKYTSSGLISKIALGLVGFLLLYGLLSILA